MSNLRTALQEYLALRRALGFKLRLAGGLLHRFLQFAEKEGASFITTELALRWATQARCDPSQWANRLGMVRRFAQYRSATDLRTEIPPQGLLPHRYHRKPPYIYRDDEVVQANRYTWIVTMSISRRESLPSAKPSSANPDWFQSIHPRRRCFAAMPTSGSDFPAAGNSKLFRFGEG